MRKKVLHVINSLTIGGAEMLLVNSLSDNGLQEHTDNIVAYFQGTSALQQRIDKRIPVYSLDYAGVKSLPATLRKLKRLIREHNIDIVHTHLNPAGVYTHLICPVPQVHTLHTTYSMDKETLPSKLFIERKLFFERKNCNLIFLSEFTKLDFLNSVRFKGRPFVLNNFIPDSYFKKQVKVYDQANISLKIVGVGRLTTGKNFEYMLDVFTHLKQYNIQLDIYGNGDVAAYEKMIAEKGINVRMMGHCSDLSAVLRQYDLFVMPSKFEGFPLSVFEAMASGIPLLLSDIAPVRSVVKEHALYFPLDNSSLTAEIILSIFNGGTDINSMTENALKYANETVRREQYITRLLSIYTALL